MMCVITLQLLIGFGYHFKNNFLTDFLTLRKKFQTREKVGAELLEAHRNISALWSLSNRPSVFSHDV